MNSIAMTHLFFVRRLLETFVASMAVAAAAQAADVVIQPSAGSALVVKDSAGTMQRLRVQEDGAILIPGWQAQPAQSAFMCINAANGALGPCAVTPQGFALPYAASAANAATLFDVTQTGTGGALRAAITNSGNRSSVITAVTTGSGSGVVANTISGYAIWGVTDQQTSAGVVGDNPYGEAVVGRAGRGCLSGSSCVAAGAVVGRNDGENGIGIRGFITNPNGGIGVLGQVGISGGSGVAGRFENVNTTNTRNTLEVVSNSSGSLALFEGKTGKARIDSAGRGFFNGGTQMDGAAIAEIIPTTGQQPMPGDVVEIDPENAQHFRLSNEAQSPLIAGVITTKPGVLMNAGVDDVEGVPALALAGRVPVKVTMEGGRINPGDLLVSSSTAGHAMRAPNSVKPGTVIGKALQSLGDADGVIEMLVMLR